MSDHLDGLLARVRSRVEDEPRPTPNFEDVGERLRATDSRELEEIDPELSSIVQRVKARTEIEIVAARGLPRPLPATGTQGPGARGRRSTLAAMTLAAAALVLLGVRFTGEDAERSDPERANAAALSGQLTPVGSQATQAPRPAAEHPTRRLEAEDQPQPEPEPDPQPDAAETETVEAPTAATKTPRRDPAKKMIPARPSKTELLDQLLDEAELAWRSGQPRVAEKHLLELVGRGRSPQADLAWGDLFTLARQLRGSASEYERWGEYLRMFPRGRHADDARAGRCRLGPAGEPQDCWTKYLEDFASGAHRGEARLGIDGQEEQP